MKREDYDALLQRALDSPYGLHLAMQGWTPGRKFRRRLYSARDRARKRGDHSFDCLSIIFAHPGEIFDEPGEVWIVRRDRLPVRDDPDDGYEAYPSDLAFGDLPFTIRARGKKRHIPQHSLGPDPYGCVGQLRCDIIKGFLMGEYDDVAERLAEAEAALPDPDPRDAQEISLEKAGAILERLAALPRPNSR